MERYLNRELALLYCYFHGCNCNGSGQQTGPNRLARAHGRHKESA
jgi:hypothetical protein